MNASLQSTERFRAFDTPDTLATAVVDEIVAGLVSAAAEGRDYVLGCPTGRTPRPVYQALAARAAAEELPWERLVIALMDEYVVRDAAGALVREDPDALHSCMHYARTEIVGAIGAASVAGGISPDHLWLADPADPLAYEERVRAAGGYDLLIVAIGASDGHIAFNPPGSPADSRTRVVTLDDRTRRDNLGTFPTFGGIDDVPHHGVTIGIATIRDLPKRTVMIVTSAEKAPAFAKLLEIDAYDPDWPASIIHDCPQHVIYVDRAAAGS